MIKRLMRLFNYPSTWTQKKKVIIFVHMLNNKLSICLFVECAPEGLVNCNYFDLESLKNKVVLFTDMKDKIFTHKINSFIVS